MTAPWPHRWMTEDGERLCIGDPERGIALSVEQLPKLSQYCGYCMVMLMLRSTANPKEFLPVGLHELGLN